MADVLRYPGDITQTIDRAQMIGPDFGRRYLAIRSAEYDAAKDITVAKLRGIMPDEFRERVTTLMAGQSERVRIAKLFNG